MAPQLTPGRGKFVEQSIPVGLVGAKFSRKYEALLAAKLDHVRLDGELNVTFGTAFSPSAVSTRHEFTKRQRLFPGLRFHKHRLRLWVDGVHGLDDDSCGTSSSVPAWSWSISMSSFTHELGLLGSI